MPVFCAMAYDELVNARIDDPRRGCLKLHHRHSVGHPRVARRRRKLSARTRLRIEVEDWRHLSPPASVGMHWSESEHSADLTTPAQKQCITPSHPYCLSSSARLLRFAAAKYMHVQTMKKFLYRIFGRDSSADGYP